VYGTITGEFHVNGTLTVEGTETHEVTGTVITFELGTGAMTIVGTYVGKFSNEITTVSGWPGHVII